MEGYDIINDVLPGIDPAACTYDEWLRIGFALKEGGYSCDDWDNWSRNDPRWRPGDCEKRWRGMNRSDVKPGSIVAIAREHGWEPSNVGGALEWDSVICERVFTDGVAYQMPEDKEDDWDPVDQVTRYLTALFKPEEFVNYVTSECFQDEYDPSVWKPGRGISKQLKDILAAISKYKDDPEALAWAMGDVHPCGAYVRINPLDGVGVANANVTDFRWCLVESDSLPIQEQYSKLIESKLPIRMMVHSGGKSLHAVVHIGAESSNQYAERVRMVYAALEKAGYLVDAANKNPARLTRLPGFMRGDKRQYIVTEKCGLDSFDEWQQWLEGECDNLPPIRHAITFRPQLPELAPELIGGVLRQGHKALLSGPSKAGKSFALIELGIALALGREWMGHQCRQGSVLYLNFEIDDNSFMGRIEKALTALNVTDEERQTVHENLDVWTLRGFTMPMDKLTPKIIARCRNTTYTALIVDPLYKVLTGDENAASDMAYFFNQFDRLATEMGSSVITCQHHSKGAQGGKRAMDRASGSGVFARDPDALIDMVELHSPDPVPDERRTAWRLEYALREFATPRPKLVWFDSSLPMHWEAEPGELDDWRADGEGDGRLHQPLSETQKAINRESRRADRLERLGRAVQLATDSNDGEPPTVKQVLAWLDGVSRQTVYAWVKESGGIFTIENGVILTD